MYTRLSFHMFLRFMLYQHQGCWGKTARVGVDYTVSTVLKHLGPNTKYLVSASLLELESHPTSSIVEQQLLAGFFRCPCAIQ